MYSKLICATAISLAITTSASAADKWQPTFEIEGRVNADRSLASPKFLIPLAQDESSMLFTDLRSRFDDHSSEEYNIGLGYRQMNGGWIYGGYVFADYLSSSNSKQYWQATAGLEALSETWDFRVNGYLPENTKHQLTAGNPGNIIIDGGGNIFIGGGVGGTFEQALGGFDAEVGYKLPVDVVDLRVFGGAYYFDAKGIDSVSGPKARFELTFNEENTSFLSNGMEFTLGAQYQNDGPREGTTTALAQFRIPFGYDGESKKLTKLEKRMTNFIERDVDIVAGEAGGAAIAQESATIAGNSTATMIDAANFGTALAGAGDLVIINGAINITSSLTPNAGQTWIGGDATVAATGVDSGRVLVANLPGTHATITATGGTNAFYITNPEVSLRNFDIVADANETAIVVMANDSQISSMNISAPSLSGSNGWGIFYGSSDNARLQNVTIQGMNIGVYLDGSPDANLSFLTIDNYGLDHGIVISDGSDNLSFTNSTITNTNGHGILLENSEDITITDIEISETNGDGFLITGVDGLTLNNIGITDAGSTGMNISATSNITASGINIANTGLHGFNASGSGYMDFDDMTITNAGSNGFRLNSTGASTFDNVTITNPTDWGISIDNAILAIGTGFTVTTPGMGACEALGTNSGTSISFNGGNCP